ncbi:unknown [Haloarcula marismortui ATCC 43049]|uniref:Tyr recombinase domain-containing protein n=1 Tax=Haloarcula marismortui (strain ATCC 43049 / DSM 3752 / JCM 8966 / VKM B-1809) TaxID=272569 RepID=Q5UWI9_HALMA|nr:unknown [Haloarcula marismortui ATCC 43049]
MAAYRDQTLVFLLAYSGARSAELVAVSDDEERNGLRWRHVNLEAGTMQVFVKNRTRESAPILDDALRPLRRWKQLREPDENEAVFPRLDNAAKALDPSPSITTQSARNILADLCEWSEYEFEDPLKPHGARRGLGEKSIARTRSWHRTCSGTNPSRQPTKATLRRLRNGLVTRRTTSSLVRRLTDADYAGIHQFKK